jgi:diguanylate cyclase (GGDEF)-like protein
MIEHSMTEAHASSYYCAVLFLDLDGFKAVNDKYGHRAGDQVLRETGRRLQDCVRHSDQVARLGGDEFIVLLNSIKKHSDAEVIAQKIVEIIHAPFPLENGASVQLSTSIGIAIYPGDAVNADELISRADEAMYAVKHREKNGYAFSCDLKESQKPNVA